MKLPSRLCIHASAAAALLSFLGLSAFAQTYIWQPTAGGNNYDWNQPANWDPTGFPSASSEVANVNSNLAGAITIRLRTPISLGTLNLGDGNASGANFGFTIGNLTGETFSLTFDSGDPDLAARINLQNTGTPTNTISAPVELNTPLEINLGGTDPSNAQRLVLSGPITTNDQPITFTGGVFNAGTQATIDGALDGGPDAVITNNSRSPLLINNVQTEFVGKIVVNNSATGSNQAGLTISHTGSLADVGEFEINGFLSSGATQNGGTVHVGQGTSVAANPGQRLTENTITFNGGSLHAGGQPLTVAVVEREVNDTVAEVNLNSGYSMLTLTSSTANGGSTRVLDVGTLQRSPGTSLFVRAANFGNPTATNATTFRVGNDVDYLVGAEAESGTNMSIIPWMLVSNTNTSASAGNSFATSNGDGIRALADAEYANNINAGPEHNVSTGGIAVGAANTSVTVNALRFSPTGGGPTVNIGENKTLIVASGGLIFSTSNTTVGAIGATAAPNAGNLQFGADDEDVEGVIWSNGTAVNRIGASISGTGGISKAGTGTLILTGVNNTFSGLAYVGSGTLQVGDGANFSTLGLSDEVAVASGARLSLAGGNMIADTATLRLEQYGLFNGKVALSTGVNETVETLFLGDELAQPGTYGSATSAALFRSDLYFEGDGILTVLIPEPGSATFLSAGLGLVLARSRRRS